MSIYRHVLQSVQDTAQFDHIAQVDSYADCEEDSDEGEDPSETASMLSLASCASSSPSSRPLSCLGGLAKACLRMLWEFVKRYEVLDFWEGGPIYQKSPNCRKIKCVKKPRMGSGKAELFFHPAHIQ